MGLSAEQFLREKLESEIISFGDGTTEFHTRDVNHLLDCLDEKDEKIKQLELEGNRLTCMINFDAEKKLKEVLTDCMTINNASAEERLGFIRGKYRAMWDAINRP